MWIVLDCLGSLWIALHCSHPSHPTLCCGLLYFLSVVPCRVGQESCGSSLPVEYCFVLTWRGMPPRNGQCSAGSAARMATSASRISFFVLFLSNSPSPRIHYVVVLRRWPGRSPAARPAPGRRSDPLLLCAVLLLLLVVFLGAVMSPSIVARPTSLPIAAPVVAVLVSSCNW